MLELRAGPYEMRGRARERERGERARDYNEEGRLKIQHRMTWMGLNERKRERERLGVTSWQDNQSQATDSELGAQLV